MKKVQRLLIRYKLVWIVLLCAMALLLFSASTTHAAHANACRSYHFVQRGQTLYSIGRWNGVSVQEMMFANPGISNPNRIYAGTWLCIPFPLGSGGGQPPYCRYSHPVAPKQTLAEIARVYGVNMYVIAEANGITNLNLIYAGSTLCIP